MNIVEAKKFIAKKLMLVTSCNEARVEAEIVLREVMGIVKKDFILNPDMDVNNKAQGEIENIIEQRLSRKPIQQILGKAHFMGLEFFVDENTLIPRDETEILVNETLSLIDSQNLKILDIGTGSGCIAISIAKLLGAKVSACDISIKALEVAKKNSKHLQVEVDFIESDVFEKVEGKFDIIVSNPPYIPFAHDVRLEKEVLNEPHNALFAKDNGLYFYKKIIKESHKYLNKKGVVLFEMGIDQSENIKELFILNGFEDIKIVNDLAGIPRVISAVKKGVSK